MADQIIIELIGDPSGLKPAEEALKELSKISEENMAAFNKANEAAGKFAAAAGAASKAAKSLADGAKESSGALESISDAASKGITSLSKLNAAIAAGAIKAATEDIKSHSQEIKGLNDTRDQLVTKLKTEQEQYSKLGKEVQASGSDYKNLSTEAVRASTAFEANKQKIADLTAANKVLRAEQKGTKSELKNVEAAMDKMKGTSDEGSKAYNELAARAGLLKKAISDNTTEIDNNKKAGDKLKTANKDLSAEMVAIGKDIKNTEEKYRAHGDAVEETKEAIMKNAQETAKALLEHNKFYKSIGTGTENMERLKTVGESVTKGMKLFGGENEQVEKGMKKLSEVIDFAKGAQSAMNAVSEMGATITGMITTAEAGRAAATGTSTVATEGSTVATTAFGAAAQSAWAAATLGVSVLIAGLIALVANFKAVKHWIVSIFGGSEIDEANKKLEETVKTSKAHSEELKKQADLMEAQGKTSAETNGIRQQQLQAEKDALTAQLALETDIEKKKEIQAQIDEKDLGIIRLQTEAKKDQEEADKKAEEDKKEKAKAHEQAYAQQLTDAKALADAKLAITTAGSKAQLDAQIHDLNAAAAVELNNAKGNAALKEAITKKLQQDIAAANQAFTTAQLQDEKTLIEGKLALTKAGSTAELDLKYDLLDKEKELVMANTNLTANERFKALNEITRKQQDLADEVAKHQAEQDQTSLAIKKTILQTQLLDEKLSADKRLDLEKQVLQTEAAAQIAAINASTKTEEQKAAEVAQVKAQLTASITEKERAGISEVLQARLAAQQQMDQQQMANLEKHKANLETKLGAIKDAASKELSIIREMEKAGTLTHKQAEAEREKISKKATDDITKAKEDAAKKEQAMEKQMAAAAINIGKQVADAIFAAAEQKRQEALASTISTLEAQKTAELSNHHLTAAQKAAIEKKFQKEEALAKEKAWKADQKAKAEQAIINGLLGFTMSLAQEGYPAGLVTGLLALAQAGVQAGIILAKHPPKFAKGVIGLDGPGTETSDSIAAYLSRGESVITAERTRQYKPVLEQIQAGIYEPLPIPMLSTLPRLADVSRYLSHAGPAGAGAMDYDKLGRAVAKNIPSPVINNIRMDENGFSKSILKKGNKTEYYNSKMKF